VSRTDSGVLRENPVLHVDFIDPSLTSSRCKFCHCKSSTGLKNLVP